MKLFYCGQAECSYFSESKHGIRTHVSRQHNSRKRTFSERPFDDYSLFIVSKTIGEPGITANTSYDKLFVG